jgi:hypothetical protein
MMGFARLNPSRDVHNTIRMRPQQTITKLCPKAGNLEPHSLLFGTHGLWGNCRKLLKSEQFVRQKDRHNGCVHSSSSQLDPSAEELKEG